MKEPRGFVRILQLLFAIFAFASTISFYGHIQICIGHPCNSSAVVLTFPYPFALSSLKIPDSIRPLDFPLYGDFSSGAQFFVFVGVITALYCVGALVLYTVFVDKYESNVFFRKVDFGLSTFIILLWFIASTIWARNVDQLKRYTSEGVIKRELCQHKDCEIEAPQGYAGLSISLVFGFSNVALWAASLWFLWKETPWFRRESDPLRHDPVLPEVDGAPLFFLSRGFVILLFLIYAHGRFAVVVFLVLMREWCRRVNKLYLSCALANRVDEGKAMKNGVKEKCGRVRREYLTRIYTGSDTHAGQYLHTR
ncbi:Synaptophysin [Echinococcus granulosus]|nr:Synaptophysin [Echinococcus granulosus]